MASYVGLVNPSITVNSPTRGDVVVYYGQPVPDDVNNQAVLISSGQIGTSVPTTPPYTTPPGSGGGGGGGTVDTTARTAAAAAQTTANAAKSQLTADHTARAAAFTAAPWTLYDGVDISGGSFVITLPAASSRWEIVVKVKVATSATAPTTAATVTPAGSDTLNCGTTGIPLRYVNQGKTYISDGAGNITVGPGDFDVTVADARAQARADAAQAAATSAAATDATSKANSAQSAATTAAASDATSKANAAQGAAATDATTKTNTRIPLPIQHGFPSKYAQWAGYTYDAREFATDAAPLVNTDGSPGDVTPVWAAFVAAMAGVTKARHLQFPDGTYNALKAATQNSAATAPHAMYASSLLGILGESRAGTIILASANSTPMHWAVGSGQLVDVEIGNLTIDCSAQTNASYTTQLKGLFMQDMLRPYIHDITIIGAWSTAIGCDYLQDYRIERFLLVNPGRQLGVLGITNPEAYSGCSGFGIGTGKYQVEAGIVDSGIVKGAGRCGGLYEIQSGQPFYSRGHVIRGVETIGCWAGLQDCGADGLDADIVATDGSYGVLLDKSILAAKAGTNGRVRLHGERNSLGDTGVGYMPDGNYEVVGVGRSTYRSTPTPNTSVGPKVVVDLVPDLTKAVTVAADKYADNFTAADGTTLSGRTAPDGTTTAPWATTDASLQIVGNSVKATAGSGTVTGRIDTGSADGRIRFTVTARNASDTGVIGGGVVRWTDDNNYIQISLRQNASVKGYTIVARVGGSSQNIMSSTVVPAVGDVVVALFNGAQFVLIVNGVKVGAGLANTAGKGSGLAANTKHGLFANFTDPTTTLDSFGYSTTPYI